MNFFSAPLRCKSFLRPHATFTIQEFLCQGFISHLFGMQSSRKTTPRTFLWENGSSILGRAPWWSCKNTCCREAVTVSLSKHGWPLTPHQYPPVLFRYFAPGLTFWPFSSAVIVLNRVFLTLLLRPLQFFLQQHFVQWGTRRIQCSTRWLSVILTTASDGTSPRLTDIFIISESVFTFIVLNERSCIFTLPKLCKYFCRSFF